MIRTVSVTVLPALTAPAFKVQRLNNDPVTARVGQCSLKQPEDSQRDQHRRAETVQGFQNARGGGSLHELQVPLAVRVKLSALSQDSKKKEGEQKEGRRAKEKTSIPGTANAGAAGE